MLSGQSCDIHFNPAEYRIAIANRVLSSFAELNALCMYCCKSTVAECKTCIKCKRKLHVNCIMLYEQSGSQFDDEPYMFVCSMCKESNITWIRE